MFRSPYIEFVLELFRVISAAVVVEEGCELSFNGVSCLAPITGIVTGCGIGIGTGAVLPRGSETSMSKFLFAVEFCNRN